MARIVIIEDSPHTLELVTYLLHSFGHVTETATDGLSGVALAKDTRPDLVLLDVNLPDIDGFEALTRLRACEPSFSAPVIALTANAMVGDRSQALAAGFDGYISKPIEPTTFNRTINAYLPVNLHGALPRAAETDLRHPEDGAEFARTVSGTIAIVTPYVGRWYFMEVFSGIEEALRALDVNLILHSTGAETARGSGTMTAAERIRGRVDGVLVVSLPRTDPALEGIFDLDVPVVMLGTTSPGTPSVAIDDRAGARLAVEHLVAMGHERIGLIAGQPLPSPYVPENDRLAGYLDVLQAHGLSTDEQLRADGWFTVEGGGNAMRRLLALPHPPTAVFCMSDEMAFGALRTIQDSGLTPGSDLHLVGFDGHDLAAAFQLTTVEQPVKTLGLVATRLLIAELVQTSGHASEDVTLIPTSLITRQSSLRPLREPSPRN